MAMGPAQRSFRGSRAKAGRSWRGARVRSGACHPDHEKREEAHVTHKANQAEGELEAADPAVHVEGSWLLGQTVAVTS